MTRKTSPSRRAAFLAALAASGNQTIAAERAKVSRSWVVQHRARDPAFDAAVREAVRQARDRLLDHPQQAPALGWGAQAGEELVVKGTGGSGGGKRVQVARARLRQWTPRTEIRFLAALGHGANVKAACAVVGLTQASAYNHRNRWPDFARRWDEVLEEAMMKLEWALLFRGGNPLSLPNAPIVPTIRDMTASEAIYLLEMHQRRQRGEPRQWGRPPRELTMEEVRPVIMRRIEIVERREARERARKGEPGIM
jgi:hypothetical protein